MLRSITLALPAALGTSLMFAACTSTKGDKSDQSSEESLSEKTANTAKRGAEEVEKQIFDAMNKNSTVITFDAGKANITEMEKTTLRATVRAVQDDSKVNDVVIASWADQDSPVSSQQKLATKERDLAARRAANVKAVLTQLGVSNVRTYNMAEYPSWLARTAHTSDAQMKGAAGKRSGDSTDSELGHIVRDKGGPSKVVVIVRPRSNVR